jgi:hypothetical protein
MEMPARAWWNNCFSLDVDIETDAEIRDIDRMEDALLPLPANLSRIRELISRLELCHHKADRWIRNIIEAIGAGQTGKGPGTRPPGALHPAEQNWQAICAALSHWSAGCLAASVCPFCGDFPAVKRITFLGRRSSLKQWQIQKVVEQIRSFICWPQSESDPSLRYVEILNQGGDYPPSQPIKCPEYYKECKEFWLATVQTIIPNSVDWKKEKLTLATAIDLLMPCHWNFIKNFEIVLRAIGGDLESGEPYEICGVNPTRNPLRDPMRIVSNTLRVFYQNSNSEEAIDGELLATLGKPAEFKNWLAASLDKTIRLQLRI